MSTKSNNNYKASENEKHQESHKTLKTESTKDNPEQKGYNEHNPSQKQGAFTPDSKTGNRKNSKED